MAFLPWDRLRQAVAEADVTPVVGRVTMDQMMVRVPDDLPVRVGDEVVLIGRQGGEEITATELAGLADTISYEIVCGISRRVPRFYGGETA